MNVNIAIEHLPILNLIEENCGLPSPRLSERDEVFGPYHTANGDGFLVFEAEQNQLTYCDARKPRNSLRNFADLEIGELEQVSHAISELRATAPCWRWKKKTYGKPFVFENWEFVWIYFPELNRWELAPLGRA